MLFVSLPVADLARSRAFFHGIGYRFDDRVGDGDALCLVLGDTHYAMLLRREVFAAFTPRTVADATHTSEVLVGVSAQTRDTVDAVVDGALAAGGTEVRAPVVAGDHLYARAYADLDGHIWEVMWMAHGRPEAPS
ncbi:MAG: VOC family protein [Kineosporiaceae bacterium]|jgi:predicted lactoylglutathione lyase